ncbi:ABC transporter ATP-binding protein [Gracilibacillus alcaliphilus]|uniref:ABC transporter ATP-binding protein n=1 Tax=Gracilibacillus alcaliphilus TaxID=1401441 RepID=UPI00195A7B11|nr:ABC transporter ATP-binding protein [Gracilibacillus alcaliphilus]MBM7679216.1 sn-glycerol 3-phosphate transport system ATP-binding protein [Gracilibacillus alcaliphilus]
MAQITLQNLKKSFGKTNVLKDISLEIKDGSFTILLGPSGCGKSTLLRILAGLEEESSGHIYMDTKEITYNEPKDRDIAMVFQNYALYPHMTVYQNIEYGLKIKKIPKAERKQMVTGVLEMVELTDHAQKRPNQLSGGQRQRVALARAIVKRPGAFFMDEPLSNLDAKLRNHMRQELIELQAQLKTTFLYVTHDQVEAMSMGTHIIILNQGEVMQQGTPKEIYTNPQNLFVAQFIGSPPVNIMKQGDYSIGIRPENIRLVQAFDPAEDTYQIDGELLSTEQLGGETIYRVKTEYGKLNVKTPSRWDSIDKPVQLTFSKEDVLFFGEDGNRIAPQYELLEDLRVAPQLHFA